MSHSDALNREIQRLRDKLAVQERELSNQRIAKDTADGALKEERRTTAILESDLAIAQSKLADADEEIEDMLDELVALDAQVCDLNQKNDALAESAEDLLVATGELMRTVLEVMTTQQRASVLGFDPVHVEVSADAEPVVVIMDLDGFDMSEIRFGSLV